MVDKYGSLRAKFDKGMALQKKRAGDPVFKICQDVMEEVEVIRDQYEGTGVNIGCEIPKGDNHTVLINIPAAGNQNRYLFKAHNKDQFTISYEENNTTGSHTICSRVNIDDAMSALGDNISSHVYDREVELIKDNPDMEKEFVAIRRGEDVDAESAAGMNNNGVQQPEGTKDIGLVNHLQ